jgi:hypothetical protein
MILSFIDLQAKFANGGKPPTSAKVCNILRHNNIPYFEDMRGRPMTTLDAINAAMGLPVGKVEVIPDRREIEV